MLVHVDIHLICSSSFPDSIYKKWTFPINHSKGDTQLRPAMEDRRLTMTGKQYLIQLKDDTNLVLNFFLCWLNR
jgi:hypothetical protein